jgi:hypothetical protein
LENLLSLSVESIKSLLSGKYKDYRTQLTHHGILRFSDTDIEFKRELDLYPNRVLIIILLLLVFISPNEVDKSGFSYKTSKLTEKEFNILTYIYTPSFFKNSREIKLIIHQKEISSNNLIKHELLLKFKSIKDDRIKMIYEGIPKLIFNLPKQIYRHNSKSETLSTRIFLEPEKTELEIIDNSGNHHNIKGNIHSVKNLFPPIEIEFTISSIYNRKWEIITPH